MAGPDHVELQRLLGGARAAEASTREGRVVVIGEAMRAMLEGRPLSAAARGLLGGAIAVWFDQGGALEDYLRVNAPRGSHRTPQRIWAALIADERRGETEAVGCDSSSTSEDRNK